jgi:uncharacterized protein
MQSSLALTALLMGLFGGPHCVAMCGAACAGLGQAGGVHRTAVLLGFQIGRILGYSLLGALAAASLQGLGWLTIQSAALRPVWSLFHVAMVVVGLILLLQARQPVLLEFWGQKLWFRLNFVKKRLLAGVSIASYATKIIVSTGLGMLWALLPCGLLYSALLVATLAGSAGAGAGVMALFALGTSVTMMAGPWLWLKLRGRKELGGQGDWGVRLAGAALALSSAWALWMGLVHNTAPWCVT